MHDLVKEFHRCQKDTNGIPSASGNGNKLPPLVMCLHFTLQLLYQIILYRPSDLRWRRFPGHTCADLPHVGIQPGEKGHESIQVGLHRLRREAVSGLLAKGRQWEMEVILRIENEIRVLMFNVFGSSGKPVSGHFSYKTPFSYSSMSSASHYVAERAARQCLRTIYYIVVYYALHSSEWARALCEAGAGDGRDSCLAGLHAPGGAHMIALLKIEQPSSPSWTWPVDLSSYDRTAALSAEEYHALAERVQRSDAGQYCSSVDMPAVLHRLTRPLYDGLDLTKAIAQVRREVVHLFLREMYFRQQAIWGWTQDDWIDLFTVQRPQKLAHRLSHYRHQVYVIGYVLCNFTDFSATGRNIVRYPIAQKVFGQEAIDTAVERVKTVMHIWGYSKTRAIWRPPLP